MRQRSPMVRGNSPPKGARPSGSGGGSAGPSSEGTDDTSVPIMAVRDASLSLHLQQQQQRVAPAARKGGALRGREGPASAKDAGSSSEAEDANLLEAAASSGAGSAVEGGRDATFRPLTASDRAHTAELSPRIHSARVAAPTSAASLLFSGGGSGAVSRTPVARDPSLVCILALVGALLLGLVVYSLLPRGAGRPSLDRAAMPLLFVNVRGLNGARQEVLRFETSEAAAGGGGIAVAPATVGRLRDLVAQSLGVSPLYVSLFRRGAAVVDGQLTERAPSQLLTPLGMHKGALLNSTLQALERQRMRAEEATPLLSRGVAPGDTVEAFLRPLKGDHIHVAFAMYHKGRLLRPLPDRELVAATSEGRHVMNLFPHFGVHTGGRGFYDDGVLHIHPGTTWQWFTGGEGLGVNLGAYLEQVGLLVWSPDSMRYPNHGPFASITMGVTCLDSFGPLLYEGGGPSERVPSQFTWDSTEYAENNTVICDSAEHVWRAYVWDRLWTSSDGAARGTMPAPRVYEYAAGAEAAVGIDRIWLPVADTMLSLSYEVRGEGGATAGGGLEAALRVLPRSSTVNLIRRMVPDGFDGRLYPMGSMLSEGE